VSLSLSAAVKAYLESTTGTWKPSAMAGCPVFRDQPTAGQTYPYITVIEGIGFAPSQVIAGIGIEIVQVDVWQTWQPKSADDNSGPYDGLHKENPLLGPNLVSTLHRSRFDTAPQRVYLATVNGAVRLPDLDANLIHNAITLWVRRAI
jgi:hypothetical protein